MEGPSRLEWAGPFLYPWHSRALNNETQKARNPNFEIRNKSKIQMLKTSKPGKPCLKETGGFVLVIRISVI